KETLVEYGFRLPSALDNRPLKFEEWEALVNQIVFVSATPAEYELQKSEGVIVEQIIRPTGLVDPQVEVRPVAQQVDDLLEEVRKRATKGERVLVTTLTKRMAEDLTEYFADLGVRVRYLHSDIDALEETDRRRNKQLAYNKEHGITPQSVKRAILDMAIHGVASGADDALAGKEELAGYLPEDRRDVPKMIAQLEKEMHEKAEELDFEGAAMVRDKIQAIKDLDLGIMPKNAQAL